MFQHSESCLPQFFQAFDMAVFGIGGSITLAPINFVDCSVEASDTISSAPALVLYEMDKQALEMHHAIYDCESPTKWLSCSC